MLHLACYGAGRVGGEVAFLSLYDGIADYLTLYDINPEMLEAQKLDILNALPDVNISIDPSTIRDADVVVFTAGKARTPDMTSRSALLETNKEIVASCAPHFVGFDGILILVTNPIDRLNLYTQNLFGLEPDRCLGFGAQLDGARFALEVRSRYPDLLDECIVLGEHGDNQVPLFSGLSRSFAPEEREDILTTMRATAGNIISGKGMTLYGPAYHIMDTLNVIAFEEEVLLPHSVQARGMYGIKEDCSIALPTIIGRDGVMDYEPVDLDGWELERLHAAAKSIGEL